MRRGLSLLLLVVLSVFALEAGVRLVYLVRGTPPPHPDPSLRNEWRWAIRHLAAGQPVLPGAYAFDPLLGWSPKPNLRDGMRTNDAGMRARRDFAEARTPGVRRIALVGDSLTLGATVADEDAFHTVLERDLLRDFEVLNLGVPGYGADQAILMWEDRVARFEPDIVVLGLYHRDYLRNDLRFKSYLKPYFEVDREGELVLMQDHVIPPDALYAEYARGTRRVGGFHYSHAWAAIRRALGQWRRIDRHDPGWRRMAALLRRFDEGVRSRGGQPFLLVIPERPGKVIGTEFEDIDRLAIEEASAIGLPAHSLLAGFHAEPDALRPSPLFRADGHLTEAGNCEMARGLAYALAQRGFVPPEVGDRATALRCEPGGGGPR